MRPPQGAEKESSIMKTQDVLSLAEGLLSPASGSQRTVLPPAKTRSKCAFTKTRMCQYFLRGCCYHGSNCLYAHSELELQKVPDLRKTKMCSAFLKGRCTRGDSCSYAHDQEELRITSDVYKTRMCSFWLAGSCKAGSACRHAHGAHELRERKSNALFPQLLLEGSTSPVSPQYSVQTISPSRTPMNNVDLFSMAAASSALTSSLAPTDLAAAQLAEALLLQSTSLDGSSDSTFHRPPTYSAPIPGLPGPVLTQLPQTPPSQALGALGVLDSYDLSVLQLALALSNTTPEKTDPLQRLASSDLPAAATAAAVAPLDVLEQLSAAAAVAAAAASTQ